jgi:phage FluMu gp28-like protein
MLKRFTSDIEKQFHVQEGELRRLLDTVPIARFSIDKGGIGRHLTENLQRDFPNVIGETATNDSKERWVTNVKILLQQGKITIPRERALVSEFHRITRRISASGKAIYEAPRDHSGHADAFSAIALAVQREAPAAEHRGGTVRMRIIGGDGFHYDSNEENQQPIRPSNERGSYEWNLRLFPDGVYNDDNPPPPLRPPVRAADIANTPPRVGRSG